MIDDPIYGRGTDNILCQFLHLGTLFLNRGDDEAEGLIGNRIQKGDAKIGADLGEVELENPRQVQIGSEQSYAIGEVRKVVGLLKIDGTKAEISGAFRTGAGVAGFINKRGHVLTSLTLIEHFTWD